MKRFLTLLTLLASFAGMWAQDSHFELSFDPSQQGSYGSTVVYAKLDLANQQSEDYAAYEVAAFVGDECRAVARCAANPALATYVDKNYFVLNVAGNFGDSDSDTGKPITFKVFDEVSNAVIELTPSQTITFANEGKYGEPSNLVVLSGTEWAIEPEGDVLYCNVGDDIIERIKDMLCDLLMEIVEPAGIWERSDVPVRRLEGLEQTTGLLRGEVPDQVDMVENGIHFLVDVKHGQKTGFFLDQKQNRAAMAPFCRDAKVLDCFCHNGSFALHAAKFGARSVLGVDISEEALEVARENARLNGLDNVTFEAHNCFDLLRELTDRGEQYDLVILDPPAFTKNKAAVQSAIRGYKEINLRGLKLVRPGGFLVTCSCSQHVLPEMFQDIVNQAARDAKKRIRLVEFRTQGYDHPILPQSVETKYLKTMFIQVME